MDNLEIFNVITPDGNGSNDFWMIRGIEDYPDNTVLIFNRWGDKIADLSGYDNKNVFWDGTNKKGEIMPAGTYYYILTINDVGSRTGWILLRWDEK
jgi:gliding motility-associated-like protein